MRALLLLSLVCAAMAAAADWTRFRGSNGDGVAAEANPPADFSDAKALVWRSPLPPGHSSPILFADRIYLTAAEGGARTDAGRQKVVDAGGVLWTYAIDRNTGKTLWRQAAPRPRLERYQPTNSPASPSPAVDASGNVYVFFGDFGLLSYSPEGRERWRLPLGPFNNANGHGTSPIVVGDSLILLADQDTDSHLLAVFKDTGEQLWKTPRPESTRSYSTPSLFQPDGGGAQLIVPGAYSVASYDLETGKKLWWVRGLSWQPKSTPIVDGARIYVSSWEGGGGRAAADVPDFPAMLIQADGDKDGKLSEPELLTIEPKSRFEIIDLDSNGFLERRDWDFEVAKRTSASALVAIEPGGRRGDLTDTTAVLWRLEKYLPNVPSPLLYGGLIYLVKDGGILTVLDPATGEVVKQGRLPEAYDKYYASPIGADGRVYLFSEPGKATVISAGRDWQTLSQHDFEEPIFGTPAFDGPHMYVRTGAALYCFRAR
jgi:outer membrane protein assembly factor BamB